MVGQDGGVASCRKPPLDWCKSLRAGPPLWLGAKARTPLPGRRLWEQLRPGWGKRRPASSRAARCGGRSHDGRSGFRGEFMHLPLSAAAEARRGGVGWGRGRAGRVGRGGWEDYVHRGSSASRPRGDKTTGPARSGPRGRSRRWGPRASVPSGRLLLVFAARAARRQPLLSLLIPPLWRVSCGGSSSSNCAPKRRKDQAEPGR